MYNNKFSVVIPNQKRLEQGIKKIVSGKLITAIEKTKQAKTELTKSDFSRAVELIVKRKGIRLGAGETIVIDAKLPIEIISGLASINVNVSDLQAVESGWVIKLELPEIYFNQLFNWDAFRSGLLTQMPNVEKPNTPRLNEAYERGEIDFADKVSDGGYYSRDRGSLTYQEIRALMEWARKIYPTNVYAIIDGELGKLKDKMNKNADLVIQGTKKIADDILNYAIKPRDEIMKALVNTMRESFNRVNEAIQYQDQAINEITKLYQGIVETAEAVTGSQAGEGDDPIALLNRVREVSVQNRQLLDSEINKLKSALNEIIRTLGV